MDGPREGLQSARTGLKILPSFDTVCIRLERFKTGCGEIFPALAERLEKGPKCRRFSSPAFSGPA
jgi:hypothetical protein